MFRAIVAVIFVILHLPALGKVENADAEQLREWFTRAEQIAHRPNSSEYRFLKQQLQNYPLYPYVEQKTLLRYPYLSNEKRIAQFLSEYENTPLDRPLRRKWLQHLARQQRPEMFLKYYRELNNVELACQALLFQIGDNQPSPEQLQQIEAFWLVGKSQPKECDPLFDMWEEKDQRSNELILKRIELAADGGRTTLIPYLKRLLPEEMRYLADLWLAIRRAPSHLTEQSRFLGRYPDIEARIITYGMKRLIWRRPELALRYWSPLSEKYPLTTEQKQQVSRSFAIALAAKNHKNAELWLEKAASSKADEDIYRWHLTEVLRAQNWRHAFEVLQTVPNSVADNLSYQYWLARAMEELQMVEQATTIYQSLAGNRHYYGFMASGKLGRPVSMMNKPIAVDSLDKQRVMAIPAMQRAQLFVELQRFTSARREWNHLMPALSKPEKAIAAYLANEWRWFDQSIHTFSDSGYLDDVERRFPLAFKEHMLSSAKNHNVNPAWAFAIARRESAFKPDARSGVGAQGLMQLLPGTVNYLERRKVHRNKLYNPEYNLEMGNRYLSYLMGRMEGNHILATASYNAGWRRVQNWIPEEKTDLDIWIETIPFSETRNYVKAVLAYKQIYHELLGYQDNYFAEYASMKIGG
ncbi:MAG: transglycosylase SLT domain-containing protein [Aestuariibacter sp.]